jgi:hypothetical protein
MNEAKPTKGFKSLFSKKHEEEVSYHDSVVPTHPISEVDSSPKTDSSADATSVVSSNPSPVAETAVINNPIPYPPGKEVAPKVKGWNNDLSEAPTNGDRVMLSLTGQDQGVLAYWRVSKYVDRAKLRYVAKGRWTDFTNRLDVPFEPLYWKPYVAEEFWPLQTVKK